MQTNITVSNAILKQLPVTITFDKKPDYLEFVTWYRNNVDALQDALHKVGAVRLRNTHIDSMESFSETMNTLSDQFMTYKDGFSPRTKLTSNVYTSTEYDADFFITLHNELSFSAAWPSKLFFCCLTASESGGQTPIADCRKVLSNLHPSIVEEFERKGVKYVRNLHGGVGPGPSWQETYETKDSAEVELFCKESNIQYFWKPDGGLKLVQYRPAVIKHPHTGEKVWFNQVDQFHPTQFDKEIYDALLLMSNGNEDDLPMFGAFGDDSSISHEMIDEVRKTMNATSVIEPWHESDLLIVDNVLVAHGRMPYKGKRKILVSMSK